MKQENLKSFLEKLEIQIKEIFSKDSSGHDIYHLKRVLNVALHLQKKEGGDKFFA